LHEQIALCLNDARLILLKPSVNKTAGIVHRSKIYPAMAALGHSRHSRHPGLSGSPHERTFGQCPRL